MIRERRENLEHVMQHRREWDSLFKNSKTHMGQQEKLVVTVWVISSTIFHGFRKKKNWI